MISVNSCNVLRLKSMLILRLRPTTMNSVRPRHPTSMLHIQRFSSKSCCQMIYLVHPSRKTSLRHAGTIVILSRKTSLRYQTGSQRAWNESVKHQNPSISEKRGYIRFLTVWNWSLPLELSMSAGAIPSKSLGSIKQFFLFITLMERHGATLYNQKTPLRNTGAYGTASKLNSKT